MKQKQVQLLFARHTETDWNAEHRYSGASDKPVLTPSGEHQAEQVARSILAYRPAALYCSDLRRSQQTAGIIGSIIELLPIVDIRLREACLGEADGLLRQEVERRFGAPELSTKHPQFDFRRIGGECRADVIRRHLEFLRDIIRLHGASSEPPPAVVIVGHGTSLCALSEHLGIGSKLAQGVHRPHVYTSGTIRIPLP